MSENLTPLVGSAATLSAGQHVFRNQERAGDAGFRNVAKVWYKQTLSFEEGLAQIDAGRAETEDIMSVVTDMVPDVNAEGNFVLRYADGRYFRPTSHAIEQMGLWADCGTWYVQNLLSAKQTTKGTPKYERDRSDSETLATVLRNGFRRLDQKKNFFGEPAKMVPCELCCPTAMRL